MTARADSWRKLALVGGVLYLMTFAFSIPAVFLLEPVLSNPDYIISGGADSQVLLGTLFDLITALACIGTAVALFPVIRRQSEAASLGFVTTRIFEGAIIVIGVASLMAVVAMRQAGGATGTDSSGLVAVGQALVAVRDQTFLLGPGVMPAFNALLLGYVLYRSRLVPRLIPAVGLIGAPNLPCVGYRLPPGLRRRSSPCCRGSRSSQYFSGSCRSASG